MRKQRRSAAVLLTALIGAGSLAATLLHPALAQENQDRTDSTEYTESRADYWAAREAWAAKKAAQQAGEDVPDEAAAADAAPSGGGGSGGGGSGGGGGGYVAPDAYPTDAQLYQLRMCESTDNYWANTGNGYYGAYQFSPITWWWLGYTGYPHQAPAWQQDEAVRYLYSLMGWSPWPSCARYLGFL